MIATTGYTGENGYEIFASPAAAGSLWDSLLEGGAVPAGLGARDTLRLEASLPLYGHELDEETSPIEANLGFAVAKSGSYIGAEAIRAQRNDGVSKKLVMLEMIDRGIPRQGYPVLSPTGDRVGIITSGSVSPWFQKQIAMAYVAPDLALAGQELQVEIRGRGLKASVVKRPYYKRPKR